MADHADHLYRQDERMRHITDATPADWEAARRYVQHNAPDVADYLFGEIGGPR